jgi:hypothetical protein
LIVCMVVLFGVTVARFCGDDSGVRRWSSVGPNCRST